MSLQMVSRGIWNRHNGLEKQQQANRDSEIYLWGVVSIDYVDEVLQALIAIPALVETQGPVGRHEWTTYDLSVLLDHCLRLRTKEEVKIKNT